MKLSDYAKKVGITYKTAYRWWKAGHLDAYQTPTGTIIVNDKKLPEAVEVALYARVSSADQREGVVTASHAKEEVERQMQRLLSYAAAKGYAVSQVVTEIASGLNDNRPKLMKLLTNPKIGVIVVEHRELRGTKQSTRFGFNYIAKLLEARGGRVEVIFPGEGVVTASHANETKDELVDDFVAVITSMSARIYGRRNAKRRAAQIKQCIEELK